MPSSRRVLVSWVGFADLRGFAAANPDARPAVAKAIGQDLPDQSPGAGPLRAAVEFQSFDEIHLLGDYDASLLRRFARWLGPNATHHRATIKDPTDYAAVYTAAEDLLASVTDSGKTDLWISLTSGTPAMAATLVLLGKTRYPARFLQSHRSEASETNIPFDLTLEYLPELLR
ncbi:MAG: hypothetical protein KDA21_13440, partial [Phycisphaerales bacterium]|nr:hypothetical protein [Phycisphaerales bacterium]